MTENDNIRHYIGSLEATEDIDVMFKHIYDLMLANGGEGSGLNADMLDGYHASDFAPASLKDDMDYSIHAPLSFGKDFRFTYQNDITDLNVSVEGLSLSKAVLAAFCLSYKLIRFS